jgi:hypothetical protein
LCRIPLEEEVGAGAGLEPIIISKLFNVIHAIKKYDTPANTPVLKCDFGSITSA